MELGAKFAPNSFLFSFEDRYVYRLKAKALLAIHSNAGRVAVSMDQLRRRPMLVPVDAATFPPRWRAKPAELKSLREKFESQAAEIECAIVGDRCFFKPGEEFGYSEKPDRAMEQLAIVLEAPAVSEPVSTSSPATRKGRGRS